jgi:hypothetical protein
MKRRIVKLKQLFIIIIIFAITIILFPSFLFSIEEGAFKLGDMEIALDGGYWNNPLTYDGYSACVTYEFHLPKNFGLSAEIGSIYYPDPLVSEKASSQFDMYYALNGVYYIPTRFFIDGFIFLGSSLYHQNIATPSDSKSSIDGSVRAGGGIKFHLIELLDIRFVLFLNLPFKSQNLIAVNYRIGIGFKF